MTVREQKRLFVITEVLAGRWTGGQAAGKLRLSLRQMRRLLANYRRDGPAGLVHGNRGRAASLPLPGAGAVRPAGAADDHSAPPETTAQTTDRHALARAGPGDRPETLSGAGRKARQGKEQPGTYPKGPPVAVWHRRTREAAQRGGGSMPRTPTCSTPSNAGLDSATIVM